MQTTDNISEFILQSNAIENVFSQEAFEDAMDAWEYSKSIELMQHSDIVELHRLLMKRLNPRIAGKYRTCDVYIDNQHKKYHSTEIFDIALIELTNDMIASFKLLSDEEKEEACKKCHILFENIHPFEDGNGRVGRIIYNWHRLQLGLPLHIIHVGDEQYEYYEWFRKQKTDTTE